MPIPQSASAAVMMVTRVRPWVGRDTANPARRVSLQSVKPEVQVSGQLTEDAANLLAEAAERGGHVVITGGSTPKAAYTRVADLGADWSKTEIWFSDERCVPPEHEHSNFG